MNQEDIEKLAYLRGLEISEYKDLVAQTFDIKHLKSIHAYLLKTAKRVEVWGYLDYQNL